MHDVIVIGAGMAGLACATRLKANGRDVLCLDKGRGPGGRMATRRVEVGSETLRFDHGAQYFTVRNEGFAAQVSDWKSQGVCAPWPAAGDDAWVGTPAMNAPIQAMSGQVRVEWGERAIGIERDGDGWRVSTESSTFEARTLVLAIPPEQAEPLLNDHQPSFAARARDTSSQPCWAVMASFSERLPLPDILREDGAIAWAVRDSAKPGRASGERWVVHATHEWSAAHVDREREDVAQRLLALLLNGLNTPPPAYLTAHRWLYALSQPIAGDPAMWDADRRLGVAGDWLIASRVESAWVSGDRLAERILG